MGNDREHRSPRNAIRPFGRTRIVTKTDILRVHCPFVALRYRKSEPFSKRPLFRTGFVRNWIHHRSAGDFSERIRRDTERIYGAMISRSFIVLLDQNTAITIRTAYVDRSRSRAVTSRRDFGFFYRCRISEIRKFGCAVKRSSEKNNNACVQTVRLCAQHYNTTINLLRLMFSKVLIVFLEMG